MISRPNVIQLDRDALDDVGLFEDGDDIGTGDGALHDEEMVAG